MGSDKNETAKRAKKKKDDAALKKCLEENGGDYNKCRYHLEAYRYYSSSSPVKPLFPLRLRRGSLTDV